MSARAWRSAIVAGLVAWGILLLIATFVGIIAGVIR